MKNIVSAFLGVSLASAASAQSFTEMAPAGPWQVNYSDHSCELGRVFGHDGKTVELQIKAFDRAGGSQQIIVASKDISLSPRSVSMQAFPVSEQIIPTFYSITQAGGYEGKVFNINDDFDLKAVGDAYRAFLKETPVLDEGQRRFLLQLNSEQKSSLSQSERMQDGNVAVQRVAEHAFRKTDEYQALLTQSLASIESLRFKDVFVINIALKTGPMAGAIKALDDCIDNLHGHWGVDVEARKSLTRPATYLGFEKFTKTMIDSYPDSMVRRGLQATVPVRVDISAEGLPTACHPLNASLDPAFNKVVCDVYLREAKFSPALDASGVPVASLHTDSFTFRLR